MISNASDSLDKIRFMSLTGKSDLTATEELSIKIKVILHLYYLLHSTSCVYNVLLIIQYLPLLGLLIWELRFNKVIVNCISK